jgi:nicotinamidase-related amidase
MLPNEHRFAQAALLIVDVVNDHVMPEGVNFIHRGRKPMSEAHREELFSNNRRLIAGMRDLGRPVIYLHGDRRLDGLDYARAEIKTREDGPWPPGVGLDLIGSWGAQICDAIAPEPSDIVVTKKAHGGFQFTVLDQILRRMGVDALIATGGGTLGCLADTVRQAASHGYDLVLVADAVYSPPGNQGVWTMEVAAEIATTDEVLRFLGDPVGEPLRGSRYQENSGTGR